MRYFVGVWDGCLLGYNLNGFFTPPQISHHQLKVLVQITVLLAKVHRVLDSSWTGARVDELFGEVAIPLEESHHVDVILPRQADMVVQLNH